MLGGSKKTDAAPMLPQDPDEQAEVKKEQKKSPPQDLQKDLEAKFDELFGSFEED